MTATDTWPDLEALDLAPTIGALHLWSQVVGKVRLALTPWENHGWHVPLYISARGLITGLMPVGGIALTIEFDLVSNAILARSSDGRVATMQLGPRSVASFHRDIMLALGEFAVMPRMDTMPVEMADGVRFEEDDLPRDYDPEVAQTYWQALLRVYRVFQIFRTRFTGKCSPIHLFWGSFDLAVTRFSGRTAPRHPGGVPHMPDAVAREAYNREVSSAGFWPNLNSTVGPCFYSYAYPAPPGYAERPIRPPTGVFDVKSGEFLLPYSVVRDSRNPDEGLLDFLQSTYEAAADLGHWNRKDLECAGGSLGRPPDGS